LGLLRFDLAGRMSVHLMEQIFDRDIDVAEMATSMALIPARKGLIKGLGQSAASIERISAVYMAKFAESPEQFWQLISSHLSDNFELDEAAKSLASLHGTEVSDGFTTMAQVLHWNGFGGNAEWLEEFDDFKFLLPHAISYHGESGRGGHFNQRMSLFGGILAPLKDHGLKTLAAYINQRMNKSRVRVYDVGSGRNAQGVSGAAEYIDGGKRLDITVADVTGSLLLEMARLRDSGKKAGKGWWIEDVRYQDLTGDLSGDSEANQYDVFSASLVLHQLMDKDSGDLEVAKVMKFASTLVRPEGVIHLPSVGEAAYLQSPVNPANLVDKEGCLPANLMERLSFKDVMTTAGAGGRFKVPYPLLRLQKHTPEGLYDDKGIYQYSLYILVAISFPDLLQLEEFKQQGRWDLCDVVISRYLDIGKIQEEVLAAVEQV